MPKLILIVTALRYAAKSVHKEIVAFLIKEELIQVAIENRSLPLINALLSIGA